MRARVKYHIIYRHREEYPISVMCAFFAVSRSGYYAFVHRLDRPEKDAALAETIAQQQERSFRTYGYRRMWLWLRSQNIFRDPRVCFKTIKVTKQGYTQGRQPHENRGLSSHIWWQNAIRDYPKFCVTAKSGANRVKFIMGGRRVIDCRLVYNITPVGRDVKTKSFISPLPSI